MAELPANGVQNSGSSSDAILSLRPSQVIRREGSSVSNNSNGPDSSAAAGKKKKNKRGKKGAGTANASAAVSSSDAGDNTASVKSGAQEETSGKPPEAARRRRNNKKKQTPAVEQNKESNTTGEPKTETDKKKKKRNRKRNDNKKHPWRKQVPEEAVDPITLDPINQLQYPPFALVADEPFEPVPIWPVPVEESAPIESEEERKRRLQKEEEQRIAEQWGSRVSLSKGEEQQQPKKPTVPRHLRPFNLYDGRALAYYMVSQLQFIDPLNRRDLTRDELLALDQYLRRHGFSDLNVTEAYDAKGITVSTAGAVANTAAGRAAILQQEASGMLQALFGGRAAASTVRQPRAGNSLASQYMAHETQQQGRRQRTQRQPVQDESGITGSAGFLVIDDSLNPGLRGAAPAFVPARNAATTTPNTLYSATHIADRYSHQSIVREHDFPSLGPPPATSEPVPATAVQRKPAAASKTLSKIGSAVRKTDPEEAQRQFEARELARRKAMMSNLTFGSNPASWPQPELTETTFPPNDDNTASEGQIERNRAFAEALNVMPATARAEKINSGWARPTERPVDEFGNELQTTLYPVKLIEMAREKIEVVLKIEKRWKAFLADDSAASLPLNRMDRPTRLLIHEYSDFWKLHTESFDPEPKRYIHCVKLRDTRAPYPLLSYVTRHGQQAHFSRQMDHPALQTAGQDTDGRILVTDRRALLPNKPRSQMTDTVHVGFIKPGTSLGGAPSRTMNGEEPSTRFASLAGRDRPKLELQKRTIPLEMPPAAEQDSFDIAEQLARQKQRAEEKERKDREDAELKQRILELAFASDEEASSGEDSVNVWEEPATPTIHDAEG